MARSQRPLRFSHALRAICGRGYSGWAFFGDTSAAQRVFKGPTAGCHSAARPQQTERTNISSRVKYEILRFGCLDEFMSLCRLIFLPLIFLPISYKSLVRSGLFFLFSCRRGDLG